MSFSVTLNTELHWVRGRKKKREMFFMHTWRLSCTPKFAILLWGRRGERESMLRIWCGPKATCANESRDSGHWILLLSRGKRCIHVFFYFLAPSTYMVHVLKLALNRGSSHDNAWVLKQEASNVPTVEAIDACRSRTSDLIASRVRSQSTCLPKLIKKTRSF